VTQDARPMVRSGVDCSAVGVGCASRPLGRSAARVPALRASAGLGALLLGAALWVGISARARAGELIQSAGSSMLSYARAGRIDAPRTLHVNGLSLRVMSGHTRDGVSTVLDFFDARCGQADGGFAQQIAALQRRAPAAFTDPRLLRPVLRSEQPGSGYLGCLDLGPAALSAKALGERLQAFAATFDLAQLGDLRFVWVRAEADGTAYAAVWSEGPVRLPQMFPARGDVPGFDPNAFPRPPRSRRVLSAWQEQEAPIVTAYRAELSSAELHARYRSALIDGGFAVREGRGRSRGQRWLVAARADSSTAVLIRAEGDARSSATLLPLR
jgi:hypothetical protein